jgi:hypothetical protein
MTDWKDLLGGTAAGAFITALGQIYINWQKKKSTASQGVLDASAIYTAMNNCKNQSDFKNIILYAAHNSGERMLACRHQFISALYEVYASPFNSMIEKMQNWRIDGTANEILSEMIVKGEVVTITDQMEEEGRLKDAYIESGVKTSNMFIIGETDTKLFFIAFMSANPNADDDARNRSQMNTCLDAVMATIKKSLKKI